MPQPDVIVIGAGAAGILAAWRAGSLGARVLLLEKTARIGTKILISGGGKCNVAHDGDLEDVLRAFRQNERNFIRPACHRLTNKQIIQLMMDKGLRVYTRPDGRVFPVDQTAKDVVAILSSYLDDAGVEVRLEAGVTDLLTSADGVLGVRTETEEILSPKVILGTGGSSYPSTGTTGDGWAWARAVGHTIVKVRAALAPVYMDIEGMDARAGIALRDVLLKARINGKEISRWQGDVLFTHRGLSGPAVLGITRVVAERFSEGEVILEVDTCPHEKYEAFSERMAGFATDQPKRLVSGFIEAIVPKNLVEGVLDQAGIETTQVSGQLSTKSRNKLVDTLKGWKLGRVRTVPLEKGEVVAGGISLDEVNPHTMESLKMSGLYLCGEVLDIAGPVGGYNLQAAFATGYVAGESAASRI